MKNKKKYKKSNIVILLIVVIGLVANYLVIKKSEESFVNPILSHYPHQVEVPVGLKSQFEERKRLDKVVLPIIMYHYIEYVKDKKDTIRQSLNINPHIFENQLKTLTEAGYTSYLVRDIPNIINGLIPVPKKGIVLTFDDGYEDFYTDAFPILKKYNMKATIYIVYDFIGRKGFMNVQELQEISKSGLVEIGAHTLDHLYLKKTLVQAQTKQIDESKKLLEDKFHIKVITFAYPYGAFDNETVDLVKQAGYIAAVTEVRGDILTQDNLLYLPRLRAGAIAGRNMLAVLQKDL